MVNGQREWLQSRELCRGTHCDAVRFLNRRGFSPTQPVGTSGSDYTAHFKFFSMYCVVFKYRTVCLCLFITMFEAALIKHSSGNRSNFGR